MNGTLLSLVLGSAAILAAQTVGASAGGLVEAGELEHARANARAGGPVSEQDADLLQRYGCTSGTNNPVCHRGYSSYRYYKPRTHKHRRHRY